MQEKYKKLPYKEPWDRLDKKVLNLNPFTAEFKHRHSLGYWKEQQDWNKNVNIQSQTFEGIIFLCRIPGLGSLRPASDSLIINGKIFSCNYSQSYSLDNTVSPLLLPISLWFLYIFSYRIYFLVDSSLSHQQLLINNCNFGLHMRVGKFWVFLLCHVVAISNRFKSWSTY